MKLHERSIEMRKHEKSKKREKRRNLVQVGEVESIYTGPTSRQEKNRKKNCSCVGARQTRSATTEATGDKFCFFLFLFRNCCLGPAYMIAEQSCEMREFSINKPHSLGRHVGKKKKELGNWQVRRPAA